MRPHQITLGAINIEAQNPTTLAGFWAAVIGSTPSGSCDNVYLPAARPDGFAMFFHPANRPRHEHQMTHLDLTVRSGSRQADVKRVLGLGASHRWDVLDEVPHAQWTTLADPEGNVFA